MDFDIIYIKCVEYGAKLKWEHVDQTIELIVTLIPVARADGSGGEGAGLHSWHCLSGQSQHCPVSFFFSTFCLFLP